MIIEFTGSPQNILAEWTKIVNSQNWCFDDKHGAILDVQDRMDMNAKQVTVKVNYEA